MKLGSMQPYFFPYLGYFDVINCVDKWIVFDTVQYIRHGWINRNRILHPKESWQHIVVPIKKHSSRSAIKDVKIANEQNWRARILGQLEHYRKRAPYFSETMVFVEDCLALDTASISQLNAAILDKICAWLGIRFDYALFSEMNLELGPVEEPQDWALRSAEAMGATEYINPLGGVHLFDKQKFRDSNIKLTFRNLPPFEYSCRGYEFVPNLSIIDLLMWNETDIIREYLDEHR